MLVIAFFSHHTSLNVSTATILTYTSKQNNASTPAPSSRKRGAPSTPTSFSDDETSTPVKKARVTKKGATQEIKKAAHKPRESGEEEGEEEKERKKKKKKPAGMGTRGRSNTVSGSKPKVSKGVKNKDVEKEDEEEEEGLVEMRFDQE